jgi:hypothetical protein
MKKRDDNKSDNDMIKEEERLIYGNNFIEL